MTLATALHARRTPTAAAQQPPGGRAVSVAVAPPGSVKPSAQVAEPEPGFWGSLVRFVWSLAAEDEEEDLDQPIAAPMRIARASAVTRV